MRMSQYVALYFLPSRSATAPSFSSAGGGVFASFGAPKRFAAKAAVEVARKCLRVSILMVGLLKVLGRTTRLQELPITPPLFLLLRFHDAARGQQSRIRARHPNGLQSLHESESRLPDGSLRLRRNRADPAPRRPRRKDLFRKSRNTEYSLCLQSRVS